MKQQFCVWRDKPGLPWEQVAGPMSEKDAKNETYNRNNRAIDLGSRYRYRWFPEGVDPND